MIKDDDKKKEFMLSMLLILADIIKHLKAPRKYKSNIKNKKSKKPKI